MLTAIAIDDEPKALHVLQLLAAKVSFLALQASFTNAFEALAYLQQHPVDVLFVDVSMPDITGIELVQGLPTAPFVIFTTAHSQYAVQGFELDAVDYLLKPIALARFTKACAKALDRKTLRAGTAPGGGHLFVKTGYAEERLRWDDILYVEADGNYSTFVLPTRRVLTRQTLSEVAQQLPPGRFVRVHRSYLIALNRVEKLTRRDLTVAGTVIPIGASYEHLLPLIRSAVGATKEPPVQDRN